MKVIEDRFVVTVALWPAAETTRLRFFVRDFRSGRAPAEALSFRARILEEALAGRDLRGRSPPRSRTVEANLLCRTPGDGFYEVFLQFWTGAAEPARVYEPEDWRVWIGEAGGAPWGWGLDRGGRDGGDDDRDYSASPRGGDVGVESEGWRT